MPTDHRRTTDAACQLREHIAASPAWRHVADNTATRVLGGATPCGAALLFARLAEEGRPGLLIASTQDEAEDIHAALRAFAPDGATIVFLPATERLSAEKPDPSAVSSRLNACRLLLERRDRLVVVAPIQAVIEETLAPEDLARGVRTIAQGSMLDPDDFAAALSGAGFTRLPQVERPGDFARRGGILDVFPYGRELPVRIECDGDRAAGIREFDPATQVSTRALPGADLVLCALPSGAVLVPPARTVLAYLPDDVVLGCLEETEIRDKACQLGVHAGLTGARAARGIDALLDRPHLRLARFTPPEASAELPFARSVPLGDSIDAACALIKGYLGLGWTFVAFCPNEGEQDKIRSLFGDKGLVEGTGLRLALGDVREGFMLGPDAAVLASREILGRTHVRRSAPLGRAVAAGRGFFSIQPGDLVVHVAHGIGRFLGTEWAVRDGVAREYLALEYRDNVKLFVPAAKADLVAKYVGSGDRPAPLDKLNGASWRKRCEAVGQAVNDMAAELLEIQARRTLNPGRAFPPDDEWQRQLEATFPFDETPDQLEAIKLVKADMQSSRCMDRLLCGDVGYGKTEIAIRAAFKAVCGAAQVAVLVPTTVLAEQHHETFSDRLSGFPVSIAVLSRFRTKREQDGIVAGLKAGRIDIVIGTHRLLSSDVAFANLGLVIIDEEQRFGVGHKERFKRLRAMVEVLTMTATPIPRTLHMALLGLRDISNLTTPPEGRAPIKTECCRFDPDRAREIILREIDRDGQVYFVHNRIGTLRRLKSRLEAIVPEARMEIAHGRMSEKELAAAMRRFLRREIDVLVTTTIIESGLDIPRVNTIFVSDADMYGLADLHQLRGRVGRSRHQAYAYLLLPEDRRVAPDGEKRLRAIEETNELGAGFQLALRDLELRGSGNILGGEQSGHIAEVGYDMYCRLLKRAVAELGHVQAPELRDVAIGLDVPAHLPADMIPPGLDRIEIYRQIASAASEAALDAEARKLEDRFGEAARGAGMLLDVQRLRIRLSAMRIRAVGREENRPVFRIDAGFAPERLAGSPVPVRRLDAVAYMLEEDAPDDMAAFRVFLEWTGALAA